jgi:hypothetical protein
MLASVQKTAFVMGLLSSSMLKISDHVVLSISRIPSPGHSRQTVKFISQNWKQENKENK